MAMAMDVAMVMVEAEAEVAVLSAVNIRYVAESELINELE